MQHPIRTLTRSLLVCPITRFRNVLHMQSAVIPPSYNLASGAVCLDGAREARRLLQKETQHGHVEDKKQVHKFGP